MTWSLVGIVWIERVWDVWKDIRQLFWVVLISVAYKLYCVSILKHTKLAAVWLFSIPTLLSFVHSPQ